MTPYAPRGLKQIQLTEEVDWPGDPNTPIPYIETLDIDNSTYRYVGQGSIYNTEHEPHITVVASEGFVSCSAFIMRNRQTDVDTFSHFWPGRTDFKLEDLLDRTQASGQINETVIVYGGFSSDTGMESGLADDKWDNIHARAISVETGSTWGALYLIELPET